MTGNFFLTCECLIFVPYMEQKQLEQYLDLAIEASIKAGAAIMEVYGSAFEVQYKADESPLTEADRRANAVIMSFWRLL